MLTLFILVAGFRFLDEYVGVPVTQKIAHYSGNTFAEFLTEYPWIRSVVTILVSISAVFVTGFILATFSGRRIYGYFESILFDLPILKKIYPSAKRLTEFIFADKPRPWTAVVAVQYPRVGMWSIGFLMGEAPPELANRLGGRFLSVYTPTSPMPLTGYVVCVPEADVIPLKISVEDALHWIVSAGVVLPPTESDTSR